METTYVEIQEMPVLRVRADVKGKGPSAAFNLLESKLPTIKGRKFYGTFHPTPDGEEYYACVARIQSKTSNVISSSRMLDCPLNGRVGVPGRKWTLSILSDIGFRGIGRFKELNKSIRQITPKILSIRLQQLEAEGLIERKQNGSPGTPVWQLTQKDRDLIPLLREWIAFRSKWHASQLFEDGQPRTLGEFFP